MNTLSLITPGTYLISLLLSVCYTTQSSCQAIPDKSFSLLFIGDIMGHDEQIWSAENREEQTYNYDDVFQYIKPVISEADIAIANFEVTLAGPPYLGYPEFSSPGALAIACKNAGIDCLVTANNHSADRGEKGITGTINILDSIGLQHTGTFLSSSSRDSLSPLFIGNNDFSLALLNYTYGTNGIAVPDPVIVNMLDKELIDSDIQKAKDKNADIIILFLHWGTEYDTVPSADQTELAGYFLSEGVDLIIGSHPHVLQKMVWSKNIAMEKDGIVVYSLGNFVSNQRRPKTEGGSMVRIVLTKIDDRVVISEAGYYLTWVYKPIVNYRKKFYILPCSGFEKRDNFFTNPDYYKQMKYFIDNSRTFLQTQNTGMKEFSFNSDL